VARKLVAYLPAVDRSGEPFTAREAAENLTEIKQEASSMAAA
jgi:hypothetical protein